ncbi:MAG: FecR domain-containing protein [Bacteroidota bacterium]
MNQDKFIKDWLEGKIDPDSTQGAEEHNSVVKELEEIIQKSKQLEVPSGKTKEKAWADLVDKIDDEENTVEEVHSQKQQKQFTIGRYIPIGIAASLLIFAIAYFLIPGELVIESGRAEQVAHVLPDGSKVTLNADSEISYSKSDFNDRRIVNLKGEGFFEIEPGNKFIVMGVQGSVEVLGTSFNAYLRKGEISVSCFTGKVKVTRGSTQQNLNPGQITKSGAENDLSLPVPFDEDKTASWRSGDFYFDQVPFSEVLLEFERQFDIKIEYAGLEERIYTGYFNNKDLDEALKLVFIPMSLDYSLDGNKLILK